jgi:hypothetical protein
MQSASLSFHVLGEFGRKTWEITETPSGETIRASLEIPDAAANVDRVNALHMATRKFLTS